MACSSTTALCLHLLKRLGITHVLNAACGRAAHLGLVNTSPAFYRSVSIEFMGIEALDMSVYPLYQHFRNAADFIEQALQQSNGKILVHCGEGISRSSTLVIAYLMIKRQFSVTDAVRTVVKHRNILPNQGFLLQLCQLHDELLSGQKPPTPAPANHNPTIAASSQDTNNNSSYRSNTYPDDYKMSTVNVQRSATPNFTSTNTSSITFSSRARSQTPTFGYSSSSSSSSEYNRTSNANKLNNYASTPASIIRPMQYNSVQRDYRRAKSVERPSYITRGSSSCSASSSMNSYNYGRCSPTPKLPISYRSYNNNNYYNAYNNANTNLYHPNHSLMTTYLVNRPLPTMSR